MKTYDSNWWDGETRISTPSMDRQCVGGFWPLLRPCAIATRAMVLSLHLEWYLFLYLFHNVTKRGTWGQKKCREWGKLLRITFLKNNLRQLKYKTPQSPPQKPLEICSSEWKPRIQTRVIEYLKIFFLLPLIIWLLAQMKTQLIHEISNSSKSVTLFAKAFG